MLLPFGAALGLLAGLLSGGHLRNLIARRLHWPLIAGIALLVKVLGTRQVLARSPLTPSLYAVSLAALIAWVLWHRSRFPGMWLVAAGNAVNLLVVAVNAGRMPVPASLARLAGPRLLHDGTLGQYVLLGPATRLGWLADIILLPGLAGRVFPQAYSPGDLVILVGLTATLFLATRPPAGPGA